MPREWTEEEKQAFSNWEVPPNLRRHWQQNNRQAVVNFFNNHNLAVTSESLSWSVAHASELLMYLWREDVKTPPPPAAPADVLVEALQSRPPEPAPEPGFAGDGSHKLQEAGIIPDSRAGEKEEERKRVEARKKELHDRAVEDRFQLESQIAKMEAESLTVYHRNGRGIDHGLTEKVRKIFAYFDASKTEINWIETLRVRQDAVANIQREQERPQGKYTRDPAPEPVAKRPQESLDSWLSRINR